MRAAISALAAIGERRRTRTIAVLGEVRELGADAVDEHRAIGADAAEAGIDVLLAVGEAAAAMATGAEQVTDRRGTAVCVADRDAALAWLRRSEEHTSELQSLMRSSYAVFCLKKKKND